MSQQAFRDDRMAAGSVLLTLSLCALWGGAVPAIKLSLQGVPPVSVAAFRFSIALVSLLIFCVVSRTRWRLPRKFHKALIGFSLIFVLQASCLNLGTKLTSSSHSVVILHAFPLFVALLAHFLIPNDRLNRGKVSGLLLSFLGISVVFLEPPAPEAGNALVGDLLVLLCGFLLAVIQVYSKFLVRNLSAFQIVTWEMIYGVPLFFLLSFFLEWNVPYHVTTPVAGAIAYQGLITGLCFVTWTHLMKRYAASKLNAFQFLSPIFGVILSWLILGESVSPVLVLGVALVAGGIALVSGARSKINSNSKS